MITTDAAAAAAGAGGCVYLYAFVLFFTTSL